jgi:hypothetical protein
MKSYTFLLSLLVILMTSEVKGQIIISSIPDSGTQCEELTITVTGENTNFVQGTSSVRLWQNGSFINSASDIVISQLQIQGVFFFNPDHSTGSYDVYAYNDGYPGEMILSDGFLLNPVVLIPELINYEPDTAYNGETILLNITGINTHFDASGVYNNIWLSSTNGGQLSTSSVTVIDSQQIEASIYINYNKPAGNYTLHLSNQLDGALILPDALILMEGQNNPEIVSVEPDSAYQGEALTLTVTGRNTTFQQGSTTLRLHKDGLGSFVAGPTNIVNDTILTGDFAFNYDHNPGLYDVQVLNYPYGDHILVDGFELLASGGGPPSLLSVSPGSAFEGTRVTLLIRSENTEFDKEGNTASVTLIQGYEELYCHDIVVVDSVTLEANFVFSYENYIGYHDLEVETPFEGSMILENCFNLIESEPKASIVNVVPDSAYLEDTLVVSVTGTGIIFMQGTSNLNISQGNLTIFATNETIINDTVISGEFSFLNTFPVGKYDVNIDNGYAWPSMSLPEGFTLELFDFIDESENLALLTVYPNPSNGLLNIKKNFIINGSCYLKVYDLKGKLLLEDQLENGVITKQMDLTAFTKGVYLLKILKDGQYQTKRFVIQ